MFFKKSIHHRITRGELVSTNVHVYILPLFRIGNIHFVFPPEFIDEI